MIASGNHVKRTAADGALTLTRVEALRALAARGLVVVVIDAPRRACIRLGGRGIRGHARAQWAPGDAVSVAARNARVVWGQQCAVEVSGGSALLWSTRSAPRKAHTHALLDQFERAVRESKASVPLRCCGAPHAAFSFPPDVLRTQLAEDLTRIGQSLDASSRRIWHFQAVIRTAGDVAKVAAPWTARRSALGPVQVPSAGTQRVARTLGAKSVASLNAAVSR